MASPKTLELRKAGVKMREAALLYNARNPRRTEGRDRSLNGKARIKARKAR